MAFTWIANDQGDLTAITAGTGISVTSPTGPIPTVAIDSTVATLTGSQTLTNKTLTSPALTTPTISTATTNGDILYGTGSGALARLGIGSTSQVLTVASGIPSWATPSSGSTFVGALAYLATSFATTTGAVSTITLDSEDIDTNSIHDNTTNNSRLTIPTGYTGKWLINGALSFASNTSGVRSLYLYKNGSFVAAWDYPTPNAGSGSLNFSYILSLVPTDYIEMKLYQNTGGNLNVFGTSSGNGKITFLSVAYLGA
jgi:hypothetical protein